MRTRDEMRDLADQAAAEVQSGVVPPVDQPYLDGVEEALRWATGDGVSADIAALLNRMQRVQSERAKARD